MKKTHIILFFVLVTFIGYGQKSPRKQATGTINDTTVTIDYGAPSVKGRKIWGGLEKFGKVWRAGANKNTTVSFGKSVTIGSVTIAPGTYGLFIIPNEKKQWVVILSNDNDKWGAFSYKEKNDAVRVKVAPKFVDENQELLKYSIGTNAIHFAWEKVRLVIPVN